MLEKQDLQQIRDRGSDPAHVMVQLERFNRGFPFAEIVEPASLSRGISAFSDEEKADLAAYYDQNTAAYDICRFVPASGAATRMFKTLFSLKDKFQGRSKEEQQHLAASDKEAQQFFGSLAAYPFYGDLSLSGEEAPAELLEMVLDEKGLNYGLLPKGLLKFHQYGAESRTAFEEHLHEAARMVGPDMEVNLHFTVSEEHLEGFLALEKALVPGLEKQYSVRFHISYSFQKPETDTIAVDMENRPFRDDEGKLVFRPGGHGALLDNLNELQYEIVFINNIDNISPDRNSDQRVLHKKMLGGLLMRLLEETGEMVAELKETPGDDDVATAAAWLQGRACVELPTFFQSMGREEQVAWLISMLDRPLRVCGMVRNEGEPGGGPFFVRNTDGEISLQIVEPSQVDTTIETQRALFRKSSHFNPVDLVCSLRSTGGTSFDLRRYVDPDTGFISEKSMKGRELKALELPGLWNGSMADWITVFAEIPAATFTPVKTVFDLVRPAHRTD